MRQYSVTCPHTREVKKQRGEFVTEGERSYFRVDEIYTVTVPCGKASYIVIDKNPFGEDSGLDPEGIEVRCKGCGKTYFLFPNILSGRNLIEVKIMGRSRIEWLKSADGSQGYTINPVKGLCPVACKDAQGKEYCYARRMYKRFKWNPEIRYQFGEFAKLPAYPTKVFVGSTMELFGDWIKPEWMREILERVKVNRRHTFIFLTKQPQNLAKWSPFPPNCWVGISCDIKKRMIESYHHLANIEASVKFISFEPLLERMDVDSLRSINWVILGSQTQPTRHPRKEWCWGIIKAGEKAGIPIFIKEPLASYLNDHRQEFPKGVALGH